MEELEIPMLTVLKYISAGLVGFTIYAFVLQRPLALALVSKAMGGDQPCPAAKLATYPVDAQKLLDLHNTWRSKVTLKETRDGLQLYSAEGRDYWIRPGHSVHGNTELAFVLAEQEWLETRVPGKGVQPGDVVLDVGAHMGSFGVDALKRGASKVIMIEPDPVNVECIRRNYRKEIAEGRAIIVPEGAWDKESTMDFFTAAHNSATGSFVVHEKESQSTLKIRVRPIDAILAELGITKVDFLKMDIEGAERQALRGAEKLLRAHKPRLMLDSYHLPDDGVVLPKLITEMNPAYASTCAACSPSRFENDERYVPYVIFYY